MKVLVLGGNSPRNQHWAESLAAYMEKSGIPAHAHIYRHWQESKETINLDYELSALQDALPAGEAYGIIAKSMGAVLAVKGIHDGLLSPAKTLLLGIPLTVLQAKNIPFGKWLAKTTNTVQVMQNTQDPIGSCASVRSYFTDQGIDTASILECEGNTHDYPEFNKIISTFASR